MSEASAAVSVTPSQVSPTVDPCADDPVAWFGRPVLDGSGLDASPGAALAARIEELAVAMHAADEACADEAAIDESCTDEFGTDEFGGRLSRHDAVSFVAAAYRQIAHLQAVAAQVVTTLTWDAAYHACDTPDGWKGDDGTGRFCPSCAYTAEDIPDDSGHDDSGHDDSGHDDSGHDDPGHGDGEGPAADRDADLRKRWPRRESGNRSPIGLVGLELSAALRVSPTHATDLVAGYADLVEHCPATWAALWAGRIDAYRARGIAEGTRPLLGAGTSPALAGDGDESDGYDAVGARVRAAVEAEALTKAADQTGAQLRRRVRRLVMAADPSIAARATASARDSRRVCQPYTGADSVPGIASLTLLGPVEDLQALYASVDAAARHARTGGDARNLDQLRFDILTGIGWAGLRLGHLGCCAQHDDSVHAGSVNSAGSVVDAATGADAHPLAGRARRPVEIRVTVSLATLLGMDEDPAELAGAGPVPAAIARQLAFSDDATWRRLITDPVDGTLADYGRTTYRPPAALADHVMARDGQCRFPTTTTPAEQSDLDHTIPFGTAGGVTAAHNLGAISRRAHVARTHHHWRLRQPVAGHFAWTSPARHTYTVEAEPLDPRLPGAEPASNDDAPF